MIETLSRRKLIGGLGLLIAAPAVVRVASLMPVKALPEDWPMPFSDDFYDALTYGLSLRIIEARPDGKVLVKTFNPRDYLVAWDHGYAHST